MEIALLFTTAFIVGLSGAMMPGPLLTVAIVSSAERGFTAGPLLVLGHGLLEIALIIAMLAGAASFLVKPTVSNVIALAGGLFLIYLGIVMIRDVRTGKLVQIDSQAVAALEKPISMHPTLAGILFSASNPFWIIWWATIGLGYLTLALKSGAAGIASFFSGHILSDFLWYTMIAYAVSKGAGFLSPRIYQGILTACGIFMLVLGGYFLYTGASGLPQMYI
ncbi:MAG TPA: LysE family transporter [Syntrophomonadaceae bacterium]|nr:LysE family transporter [Syntrophomonadaceae bacterium]HPR94255.1 LysE family transporter [Syntrophomonadaceae bacterium]